MVLSLGQSPYDAPVERFRVVGGARLEGEVRVSGAKNSVLKLMAAALLAPGRTTVRNVPDILDVEIMSELLVRLGCDGRPRPCRRFPHHRRPAGSRPSCGLRPRPSDARLHQRPGPARGAVRCRRGGPARRGRHRVATARLPHRRPGQDGRDGRQRARVHRGPGAGRPARRADLSGLPQRGGDREPAGRSGPREGHERHRQRRTRAGDRRRVPDAPGDGRADRRDRELHARDRRRRCAGPHRPHDGARPDGGGHLGGGCGHDPRGPVRSGTRARTTSTSPWTS